MTDSLFWLSEGKPNCAVIKEHLRKEGKISNPQLITLIELVYEIFCAEDNVLEVDAPVTVCGDVHGQYYDLLKLLEVGGDPASTNYLFLGDYVDRGLFSIECLILLFCYKLSYPHSFFMLRGNHECRHLTDYFTFREECVHKYSREIYDSLMDCFDALPLAAIMNKQFFCVHGGLSPEIDIIEEIKFIDRFCEPPPTGAMCDLLWADPMENFSTEVETPFEFNTVRGCSSNFSFNAVCDFLEKNNLLSVIRAHEAQDAGYKMHKRNDRTGFPSLITLFSAPNYLDSYNNKGALMRYENNIINIRQFNASPHPYILPGFMNVFNWSLPFVAEKITELISVFQNLVDDAQAEQQEIDRQKERDRKREALRNKIKTVSRMLALYKKLRVEREIRLKSSPEKEEDKTLNVARPPGVVDIIEAAKIEPRTPEAIRRRQSRDKILSLKKQEEYRRRFPTPKVYDAKDFESPPRGNSVERIHGEDAHSVVRALRFSEPGSPGGNVPASEILPSPSLVTTTAEGKVYTEEEIQEKERKEKEREKTTTTTATAAQ
uniref:Serine/threonine-protein phosphatase n=1 Tax=Arcella intermedia TaxID=1963864 RepID=A0A6B2KZW6_9EUKA